MPQWLFYALLATFFAGLTSVLAKFGLKNIPSDLGLAIRTTVVFLFITTNILLQSSTLKEVHKLSGKEWLFLAFSGITTSLSWIYYYRAMKIGSVSYVAAIDKGSIVITILLSFLFLKEPISPKLLAGAGLILAGMLVLIWK